MIYSRWLGGFSYVVVGLLSIGLAFLVSMKFVGGLKAQQESSPPPPGAEADVTVPPSAASVVAPQATNEGSGIAQVEGFLEPFLYDVVNRRDPFLAYAEYVPADDAGGFRPLSPAQRFALEDLKLVGILWDVKDPKALFIDPDKEPLTLGRDDSIGNRNGYVAAIRESEVVVVEALRKRGDIIYRTKVLRIER